MLCCEQAATEPRIHAAGNALCSMACTWPGRHSNACALSCFRRPSTPYLVHGLLLRLQTAPLLACPQTPPPTATLLTLHLREAAREQHALGGILLVPSVPVHCKPCARTFERDGLQRSGVDVLIKVCCSAQVHSGRLELRERCLELLYARVAQQLDLQRRKEQQPCTSSGR